MMSNLHTPEALLDIKTTLQDIKHSVTEFLYSCMTPHAPFGHFRSCAGALTPHELDAATAGIELWVMLGLPLSGRDRANAIDYLCSFQNPRTGLVFDPSWQGRDLRDKPRTLEEGDTFFTTTSIEALRSLGTGFQHPIHYLAAISAEDMTSKIDIRVSALNPFSIGDCSVLIAHNISLGVPGAKEQWKKLLALLLRSQDATTGLWMKRNTAHLTPSINRTFHFLRSTWNLVQHPYLHVDKMMDSALSAGRDSAFYQQGDACDDLDLAHVVYGAACWTNHRAEDVRAWALKRLSQVVNMQLPDGGFPYKHQAGMSTHNKISISPGQKEGDVWGTLMYMGAIKMMAELAYPGVGAPWKFSQVHRVPVRSSRIKSMIQKGKLAAYNRFPSISHGFEPSK